SGAALATCWAPSTVLAPGRFSTTTGWPQSSLIFWPIMRARTSDGPPAGKGTTILIDLVGNASGRSCAAAGPIIKAETIANAIQRWVMAFLPSVELDAAVLDHLLPAPCLLADEGGKLIGRAGHGVIAGPLGLLPDRMIGQDLCHLGVDLL